MAVAFSWTGKAARFTQSNRHNAQDFPANGISPVGETSVLRSKRRKTTQTDDGPRPLPPLSPMKLGARAIGHYIGNVLLIRDVRLLCQGMLYQSAY